MTEDIETPSKLRQWRKTKGWSQQEVADLTGLHVTTVGEVERGEARLAPETKVRFARALGVRVADLFESESVLPEAVG